VRLVPGWGTDEFLEENADVTLPSVMPIFSSLFQFIHQLGIHFQDEKAQVEHKWSEIFGQYSCQWQYLCQFNSYKVEKKLES
jgi:hypothetical protein